MSYGYDTHYPPAEYAQPHTDHYFAHPDSAAAQLGLTPEEIKEVVDEQERWYREEYLPELEAETQHQQQQHSNNTQSSPTPTTHLEPKREVYEGHGIADEGPIAATSHDDDDGTFECGDSPAAWYQPPTTILEDARAPPSPLEHDMDTTTADHDMHVASFEHHEELDNRAAQAEPDHYTMIKLLTDELAIPDDGCRDWANVRDIHSVTLHTLSLPN